MTSTISHKNLTTTQLHESKGVDAASDDTVLTVTSHASVFKKLTAANLTGTGNPFGAQLYHLQEQQPQGTHGGSPNAAAWTKRALNTALTNEISGASVSSSVISLPAGTYFLDALSIIRQDTGAKLRLRNTTAGTSLLVGLNVYDGNLQSTAMPLRGRFTLAGTSNLELQYWAVAALATSGFGAALSSGELEVYTDAMIWKIA